MGSRWLTDMADVLRRAGVPVVEQDGWQTRARSSGGFDSGRPWCVMWHHTASSPGSDPANDAHYMSYSADSKPIANILLDRVGTAWVLAAGATNTNGKGSGPIQTSKGTVPSDSMNVYAIGVEIQNSGVGEPYPAVQMDNAFKISLALCEAYGLAATDVGTHQHYAFDRKIDPATYYAVQGSWMPTSVTSSGTWSLDDLRDECARRARTTPVQPNPPEDDEMAYGPYLIQASGKDGTPEGTVFACDRQFMTVRAFADWETLQGYRWQLRNAGASAPELNDDGPIMVVDDVAAFGVIIT